MTITVPVFASQAQIIFNKKLQLGEPSKIYVESITGIAQDLRGFIWLTSKQGLLQYDGISEKAYRNNPLNSNSFGYNSAECLFIDEENIIWIGSLGGGLDRFDPFTNTFKHFRQNPKDPNSLSNDSVYCILKDSYGLLWIGTSKGLSVFDPKTESFKSYYKTDTDNRSLSDNIINVIYEDLQKEIWIGCGSPWNKGKSSPAGGLNRFDRKKGNFTRYVHSISDPKTLTTNIVTALYEDSKGNFWVGTTGDGLHRMDRNTGTFTHLSYDPLQPGKLSRSAALSSDTINVEDHIRFFTEDVKGGFWIATVYGGISRLDPGTNKISHYGPQVLNGRSNLVDTSEGFRHYIPWQKMRSRDGLLWIATADGGLYNINFSTPKLPFSSLPGQSVISFKLEEDKKILWIGTNKGVIKRDLATNTDRSFVFDARENSESNIINSIKVDKKNNVWIGSSNGLHMLDQATEQIIRFRHNPADPKTVSGDGIYAVFPDGAGNFWIGTNRGLDKLDINTRTFTHYNQKSGSVDSYSGNYTVYDIETDNKKNLWLGTSAGLDYMDQKTGMIRHYLPNVSIWCIFIDVNNDVWTTSSTGLYLYNQKTDKFSEFLNPKTNERFFDIIDILEDDKKYMWVRATREIIRISPDHQEVKIYSEKNGTRECNPAFDRYNITDSKGNVYMVADGGFHVFNPAELDESPTILPIVFNELKVNNREIFPTTSSILKEPIFKTKELSLSFAENDFSLRFLSFDYTENERINYYAKLEGYDKDWRYLGSYNSINYFNVPPGKYIFHARAINSEGVSTEKTIAITVHPPWWRTWWAYTLYAILFFAGIWSFISYRSRSLKFENQLLEGKVADRTAQLSNSIKELKTMQNQLIHSEKMASLGELTAGIAHEIQNPLNFVNNFSEVNTELIDEMQHELNAGKKEEAIAISNDIKANEEKINHHGKRADAIVKGMLQHSRSSNGIKEPTNINVLADEYLQLSYHGLRAKDKTFNATLKTDYDENLSAINVIPQDIGRVILNLFTNAFYSVAEKKKQNIVGYEPTVSTSTKKAGNKVEIRIRDNGMGIPQKVMDKVFQPFFTTKPTGQGTGLGLSMSYDIITKGHGGELKAETKEGEFAEFVIILPL